MLILSETELLDRSIPILQPELPFLGDAVTNPFCPHELLITLFERHEWFLL